MSNPAVQACAEIVAKGDPDRFASAMTAPVADREVLFPLYAFNLEVAKAPWLTKEPLIAEMRLQFWRDVLDEIDAGKPARAHEVAAPLADAIRARAVPLGPLREMIDARREDIAREPFVDAPALWRYLELSAGGLMSASMRALAEVSTDHARLLGRAQGLAHFLIARPTLESYGWHAVADDVIAPMIDMARADLATLPKSFGPATPAARAAWRTAGLLRRATPSHMQDESEFARRFSLMWKTARGRW